MPTACRSSHHAPASRFARRRSERAPNRRAGLLALMLLVVALVPAAGVPAQPTVPRSALDDASRPPYPGSRRADDIARQDEFVADVVGWLALGRVLWSSGYDQVLGSPKSWPRTSESYGRRFTTRSAQLVAIEVTRHGAAAVLHRDPAYVKCACAGVWRRLQHVALGTVTDFDVDGRRRVAWPRFLGAAVGSVVLGQLQPGQGAFGTVALRGATTVGGSWFGNITKEFGLMPGGVEPVVVPRDSLRDG